jgi:hypothetical protein
MTEQQITVFFDSYLVCALWSSSDDDGGPLAASFTLEDISEETLKEQKAQCVDFLSDPAVSTFFATLSEDDIRRAGHDFWLTRNGHGAGFWDGDWPESWGDRLTERSHTYGEVYLYLDDDDFIYGE